MRSVGCVPVYELTVLLHADKAIGAILRACEQSGYTLLVTADHGNAETMIDDNGKPVTKHTTNKGEGGWLAGARGSLWGDNLMVGV